MLGSFLKEQTVAERERLAPEVWAWARRPGNPEQRESAQEGGSTDRRSWSGCGVRTGEGSSQRGAVSKRGRTVVSTQHPARSDWASPAAAPCCGEPKHLTVWLLGNQIGRKCPTDEADGGTATTRPAG